MTVQEMWVPTDAPARSTKVGRVVGNRYRTKKVLGVGGMGIVYLASDLFSNKQVAIKSIDLERNHTTAKIFHLKTRLRRESSLAKGLLHPNIVRAHELLECDGIPYLIMEFIDGPTLTKLLARGQPLPLALVLKTGIELLDALAYSHAKGVIHRDIKPANVMLDRYDVLKVTDFGLAWPISHRMAMLGTGHCVGTARYAPPELLMAKRKNRAFRITETIDIFQTGILMYEMITGTHPFSSKQEPGLYSHQTEPRTPSTFNDEVPPWIDAAILKAISNKPIQRYQSADEFKADLRAAGAKTSGDLA